MYTEIYTNSDSKIAPRGYPGDKEEATEARGTRLRVAVHRGDDDEVNKVICKGLIARVVSSNMKANWYKS